MTVFLAQENAHKALAMGVTIMRDLGSSDNMGFDLRECMNRSAMVGPRMFVDGNGLHMSSLLYKVGAIPDAGQCDGVEAVQRVARQQLAAGAEETARRHWVDMARSSVALDLLTPAEAAEAYDIPLEPSTAPGPDHGK